MAPASAKECNTPNQEFKDQHFFWGRDNIDAKWEQVVEKYQGSYKKKQRFKVMPLEKDDQPW